MIDGDSRRDRRCHGEVSGFVEHVKERRELAHIEVVFKANRWRNGHRWCVACSGETVDMAGVYTQRWRLQSSPTEEKYCRARPEERGTHREVVGLWDLMTP